MCAGRHCLYYQRNTYAEDIAHRVLDNRQCIGMCAYAIREYVYSRVCSTWRRPKNNIPATLYGCTFAAYNIDSLWLPWSPVHVQLYIVSHTHTHTHTRTYSTLLRSLSSRSLSSRWMNCINEERENECFLFKRSFRIHSGEREFSFSPIYVCRQCRLCERHRIEQLIQMSELYESSKESKGIAVIVLVIDGMCVCACIFFLFENYMCFLFLFLLFSVFGVCVYNHRPHYMLPHTLFYINYEAIILSTIHSICVYLYVWTDFMPQFYLSIVKMTPIFLPPKLTIGCTFVHFFLKWQN